MARRRRSASVLPVVEVAPPCSIDFAELSQLILRFHETPTEPQSAISDAAIGAIEPFIHVLQQLRSSESGWSPDVPQTPETLAPYIAEEAYEVIQALQANAAPPVEPPRLAKSFLALDALLPWLLWSLARSSYEIMRLIEGVPAQRSHPAAAGILRLVTSLEITASEFVSTFDLATQQAQPSFLANETVVQSDRCAICQEPTAIAALLEQITEQIQIAVPILDRFMQGVDAELLIPHQIWQTGHIRLHLAFEFIALPDIGDSVELLDGATALSSPLLQFTETDWLENYATVAMQRQIQQAILALPGFQAAQTGIPEDPELMVPLLVRDGCQLMDWLDHSLARSTRLFLHQPVALDQLSRWLLWGLSRNAYEIMQLLGGVRSHLLQPGSGWQRGTLRLLASLRLKTVERDWHLDLSTGQFLPIDLAPIAVLGDSIVQSDNCEWCQHPDRVQQLHDRIQQHIEQTTPELQLLMQGSGVDLSEITAQWEPGAMQLEIRMDFIPD